MSDAETARLHQEIDSLRKKQLQGKALLVGLPIHRGTEEPETKEGLDGLKKLCQHYGITYVEGRLTGESLIGRGRDVIASWFLDGFDHEGEKRPFTHLMFIDSDISFNPQDVIRLMLHDVDLVGGIYPKKCENPDFVWGFKQGDIGKKLPLDLRTGLIELDVIGTGFMLAKRRVFETMIEALDMKPLQDKAPNAIEGKYYWFFGEGPDEDNVRLSEDYWFCRMWQKCGGVVYGLRS